MKKDYSGKSIVLSCEVPYEIKESIKRGLKQADKGELKIHAEVMKKYKKWFKV